MQQSLVVQYRFARIKSKWYSADNLHEVHSDTGEVQEDTIASIVDRSEWLVY